MEACLSRTYVSFFSKIPGDTLIPGAIPIPDSRVNVLILCCKLKNGRTMTIVIHQLSLNIMSLNQDCTVCDLTE